VARRIRSGTVGVNGGLFYGADAPFGGYKASGFGRQNGLEGFEQYLETKTIAGPLPPDPDATGSSFLKAGG
jgi:aldehyde dehydrogenase (NAD+)